MKDNNEKYEQIYTIATMRYQEENPGVSMEELYPVGWHTNDNYKLKVNIIAEALKKHVLVIDTELYNQSFVEGVIRSMGTK